MPSFDFAHPHVLSAELTTDRRGIPFIEVITDIHSEGPTETEFRAMCNAMEAKRKQQPPQKRGQYTTFITKKAGRYLAPLSSRY